MVKQMIQRDEMIRELLFKNKRSSSSDIHSAMAMDGHDISLVTIKRDLAEMEKSGVIIQEGAGPATTYSLTVNGKLTASIDAHDYCSIEPDRRYGNKSYNFELFKNIPYDLFSDEEIKILESATAVYHGRKKSLSETLQKKELERFIIELSWKSSKIEGNTYTLLDTERLIEKGIEAEGKTKEEATMILNHKQAFFYIFSHQDAFLELHKSNLESLHRLVVEGLNVTFNLRSKPVGVTGSIYRPLDNQFQIAEAVEELDIAVKNAQTPYEKALIALIGVSYIQPFEDGNKRTSRLMGNALLLSHDRAPLSYRSIKEEAYREAVLVFYELNSLVPLKKIFMEQYCFAAENYAI